MDFDTQKEQWQDIEERDGIRLSWNTFPSSRMVWQTVMVSMPWLTLPRKHRVSLYLLLPSTLL